MAELLDAATTVAYLARHGLLHEPATATAHPLGGGVSNVVVAVHDGERNLVVKQSLPRLRVADEWLAPQARVLTEAAALCRAGEFVPGSVPVVHAVDPEQFVIVLEHAPDGWTDWKTRLLGGLVDPTIAARVGAIVAAWHSATRGGRGLPAEITAAADAFAALRVEPYYRTTARRAPELARPLLDLAAELVGQQRCLVHGDLSPKNILTDGTADALWVIDFEVAHLGDPAFDLAFLLNHLILKSVRRPDRRGDYDAAAWAFAAAYADGVDPELAPDWAYVLAHVGALLLARVRGKSPVEYLDAAQQHVAWQLGSDVVRHRPDTLAELAELRDAALP